MSIHPNFQLSEEQQKLLTDEIPENEVEADPEHVDFPWNDPEGRA